MLHVRSPRPLSKTCGSVGVRDEAKQSPERAALCDKQLSGTASGSVKPESPSARLSASQETAASTPPSSKQAGADKAVRNLHIIHFNDVYNIECRAQEPVGGAAKFVHKCRELREKHDALVLFAGDAFSPSIMSTVTKGEQMPLVLNNIGVDVSAIGNHDLDFGLDRMKELVNRCNFPWLMANVLDKRTKEPLEPCKRYHVMEHSGVRIGVVGLVEYEWLATLATLEVGDLDYLDFVEEGRRLCKLLREEERVDTIIALTHMRVPNDMLLGAEVPDIDIILGGHDHHYEVTPCDPNETLMFKSGTDFRDLSLIKMEIGGGGKPRVSHEHVRITSDIPDDGPTAEIVDEYLKLVGERMNVPIGASAVPLDGRFNIVRSQESNLGNFVCDTILHALNVDAEHPVDFAAINSGTLRSDTVHEAGQLKHKDIVEVLPMMDEMAVIEISGDRVLAALENAVSMYPKMEGRFLQVAGLCFEFDPAQEPGARVVEDSVLIGGKPLEREKAYTMGTKAYLIQGKDGFDCFRDCKVLRNEEDCPHLPTIMSQHFVQIEELNAIVADGGDPAATASAAAKRLLAKARRAEGNDSSAIIRFFPDENAYMVDPAVDGRIVCLASDD